MAASSSDSGQAQQETPASTGSKARGFAAAWASKLGQKASELKNATKDAVQQTKEAFAAEAKLVAKDMADLKDGVAEGMRLTVQDTSQLRERIGQQTRKVFASKDTTQSEATDRAEAAGEEDATEQKKSFFGPETAEHLKEKVQDLKAGGKKAAEKVRDVGGKLWHKTDHWFHQLRGDSKDGTRSWEECHQHALQLYEPGVEDNLAWTLEELKMGTLQVYAKSAVIFQHPSDKAFVDEWFQSSQCAVSSTARMAAYCQTPLLAKEKRCDVHVFSFSPSFLEVSDDRRVLQDKLKWLCYTVSACASQHQLSSIAWHLPGGADVSFLEDPSIDVSIEGLQELCKMMMKDQLKAFPEVDLVTRLPEIPGSYFDSPGWDGNMLFVNEGEPWQGPPARGGFSSCTALTLLCRPATNPYLNQVSLAPPEEKVPPVAAAVDLLDVAEEPELDQAAVVIGDDDLDETIEIAEPKPAELPSAPSLVPNGAGSGYPTEEAMVAPTAVLTTEVPINQENDWLAELTEHDAAGSAEKATPEKGIVDADFDALWDSMMDDDEAPKEEVANGAS